MRTTSVTATAKIRILNSNRKNRVRHGHRNYDPDEFRPERFARENTDRPD